MISDLGGEEGLEEFKTNGKCLIIDADTISYAACSVKEYADDLLPRDMYTEEEWAEAIDHPGYDEEGGCIWLIDDDEVLHMAVERIEEIRLLTNTEEVELYFTEGRNFRYDVYDMYKANRKSTRYPVGNASLKRNLLSKYRGKICREYEADDYCVALILESLKYERNEKTETSNLALTRLLGDSKNASGQAGQLTKSKIYRQWDNMMTRCYNKSIDGNENYINNRIKVYEPWVKDFNTYREFAMSHGWFEGCSIDRIDNLGHYVPSNVQFIAVSTNVIKQNILDSPKAPKSWDTMLEIRKKREANELWNRIVDTENERTTWSKYLKETAGFKREEDYIASKLYEGVRFKKGNDYYIVLKDGPQRYRNLILSCVDKDLIGSVPSKVFNYYRSAQYNIDMKWVETSHADAYKFKYIQTLTGDSTDGIKGCPGIGPKKAEKALEGLVTPCDMWKAIVSLFISKGLTEKEALRDMRLVNMEQVSIDCSLNLWSPPTGC